jgi:AcrR family transcriptional regulator
MSENCHDRAGAGGELAAVGKGGRGAEHLPPEKVGALEMLVQGKTMSETAQAAGVSRRTLHRWLKNDAAFAALYNQWHEELKENCRSRVLMLGGKAAAALEKALEAGDSKAALAVLKGIGVLTPMAERPTDEEEVRKEAELERKRRENERRVAEIGMRADLAVAKSQEKMWRE